MNIGNITQLTEREPRPLRRKEIEAAVTDEEKFDRVMTATLTQLAYRYPHKALELADRIRREALLQENA